MKLKFESSRNDAATRFPAKAKCLLKALSFVGVVLFSASSLASDPMTPAPAVGPGMGQAEYATPEDAADAFVQALSNDDKEMLGKVFGTDYREVLPLDDVDTEDVDNFIAAWSKQHSLLPEGDQKRLIAVGEGQWTFPVPIVEGASGWYFDIQEGLDRMLVRQIGRNELSTMQAILAYYDAQKEYAEEDRNGDGMLEYAQRFVSTPGTRDGLYWEVPPGETLSPLGPLLADHTPGSGGYHGYLYRILTAQGEHAAGGARSYIIGDRMRSGFAAIAWPVVYGETGVMSFMVNQAGVVYEQDLGPDGAAIAEGMTAFDPGPGWTPVEEVSDTPVAASQ